MQNIARHYSQKAWGVLLMAVMFLTACQQQSTPTAVPPTLPIATTGVQSVTAVPPTNEPTAVPPTQIPTEVPPTVPPTEEPTAVPPTATPADVVTQMYEPNVVVQWNELMLAAIRNGAPRPTVTARSLFIVHAAMYDAWSMFDETAVPTALDPALRRPVEEHTIANKAEAISYAAYHTLIVLYPAYEESSHAFSRFMAQLQYPIEGDLSAERASVIGSLAAQAVLDSRANDGSNAANNYVDIVSDTYPELYTPLNSPDPTAPNGLTGVDFNPNHWQPLRVPTGAVRTPGGLPIIDISNPASFVDQKYLTPHWGAVVPFALTSGDEFRPQAPPQFGSDEPYTDALGNTLTNNEAYVMQVNELLNISANLTDEQKVIAEYWADGPRSETPPGHWNAIAHGISWRDQHTIDQDVKMYFALNGAVFDASIAAWDAKRAYDYIRPASAIGHMYAGQMIEAWGGPNQGTQSIPGETWRPYQDSTFVTPPFPEYVSGHSTFSAAAAAVLTAFSGTNAFYDGKTIIYDEDFNRDGLPDMLGEYVVPIGKNRFESTPTTVITLQWATLQDAANEAGISRRYGGIHFQDADLFARKMGTQIGEQAFSLAEKYWSGTIER